MVPLTVEKSSKCGLLSGWSCDRYKGGEICFFVLDIAASRHHLPHTGIIQSSCLLLAEGSIQKNKKCKTGVKVKGQTVPFFVSFLKTSLIKCKVCVCYMRCSVWQNKEEKEIFDDSFDVVFLQLFSKLHFHISPVA